MNHRLLNSTYLKVFLILAAIVLGALLTHGIVGVETAKYRSIEEPIVFPMPTSEGVHHPGSLRVIEAKTEPGEKYWRVVKVELEVVDYNDRLIIVSLFDENGSRLYGEKIVLNGEFSGLLPYLDEKKENDPCNCNYITDMYGDDYSVYVENHYPSDQVAGMIVPRKWQWYRDQRPARVNYRVTFQLMTHP